ncbi:uncharacterized protein LOC130810179 [Amaranthus tricolor]|uniref:uncharacterized protein LOC130810179 n=1 Tax=Amaranthus tricolor TaxID=29722 RepID=UPI0025890D32|nr:uncharacterized protein LOC130810179 [Amaranthus tricolor]
MDEVKKLTRLERYAFLHFQRWTNEFTRLEYDHKWLCHEVVLRRELALYLVGMSTFLTSEFGGQVHYTNLGITPSGDFFRPGPPECPGDGKRRLSNDYQLWDQISKAPAQVTVADFHQRLADDYYQDPLMGYRAVASFDIDQVVPPVKHRQLCGVSRVPHFQSKFNDVPAWVHPDFNLFS